MGPSPIQRQNPSLFLCSVYFFRGLNGDHIGNRLGTTVGRHCKRIEMAFGAVFSLQFGVQDYCNYGLLVRKSGYDSVGFF